MEKSLIVQIAATLKASVNYLDYNLLPIEK